MVSFQLSANPWSRLPTRTDVREPRGSSARESARTIHALVEIALQPAAASIASLQPLREPERDAGAEVVAGGRLGVGAVAILDEDEVRLAPRQAYLDVAGGKLRSKRQRRLGEDVEQTELERGLERRRQPLAGLGGGLVAEGGSGGEVGLDCPDMVGRCP